MPTRILLLAALALPIGTLVPETGYAGGGATPKLVLIEDKTLVV